MSVRNFIRARLTVRKAKNASLQLRSFDVWLIDKEKIMSLMCPMEGCKQKQGMCNHEKMMLVMIILAVIAGLVVYLK